LAVERCKNNLHYYDTSQHSSCPYCGVEVDVGKTVPRGLPTSRPPMGRGNEAETQAKSEPGVPGEDPGLTVGYIVGKLAIDPVVGWLVCIEGADRGRDYPIRSEFNWIGRSETMRIAIAGDEKVSRENHAVVGYDPQANMYTLGPGTGNRMVYHNDKALFAAVPLQRYDRIKLGDTTLVFVPFLGDDWPFRWV
jgi:hypothetical protein